jgi:hypothetical protein
MKFVCGLCLLFSLCLTPAQAVLIAGRYDLAAIRNPATLETKVIEDWHPAEKDPSIKQKHIEITVCEWWPGQKVRLPVTMSAPADGGACTNVIVGNMGLTKKATLPTGAMLRMLKEHGVGVVLIGMTSVDAMEPVGKLDVGMKQNLLKTKDMRFTPAWIWGISDMRALTAAMAEKGVFQPKKVLATGGSKRGVATAAAGVADDRFTALMPVVAPIIDSPGGPYVEGMMPVTITQMDTKFLAEVTAGKIAAAPPAAAPALITRQKIRAAERITLKEARDAGWSQGEIRDACTAAWEVSRLTNYLPALKKRNVAIFYNQGTNDNVSPGLVELGKKFPDLHIYVVPGGQHGGAKEAGFLKQVGSLPEVEENLFAFAQHHFLGKRPLVATPKVTEKWDKAAQKLQVTVTFPDHTEPQKNDLWWSVNRHPDYSLQMEYDAWQSAPLRQTAPGVYTGEIAMKAKAKTLDFVTVHAHTVAGSTLTLSGPLKQINVAN